MKILLAGDKGFIGSYLYSHLEQRVSITSIDYSKGQCEKNYTQLDLTDINQVKDFAYNCSHFDVLIFLVGLAHAKGRGKDLPEFKKINYQTLINLLSTLENNKIHAKNILTIFFTNFYKHIF